MAKKKAEVEQPEEGSWSSLKKTIIGAISTAILAGGTWVTTHFLGGGDSKEETKTEQTAPAAPVINLNVDNSSKNMNNGGGTTTIIKEKEVVKEKAAEKKEEKKKSESEDAPW